MIGDIVLLVTEPPHVGVCVGTDTYMCEDSMQRTVSIAQVTQISSSLTMLKQFEEAAGNV